MIVVIGLLALIATVVLAAASVATSSASTRPLSDSFVISRQHLKGCSLGSWFVRHRHAPSGPAGVRDPGNACPYLS